MVVGLLIVWIAAVGIGMKVLLDYQSRPGRPASAPASWPASSRLPRTAGRPELVMIAHPRCPCTRATVSELSRLMARTQGRLDVSILFVIPRGFDRRWAHADLWYSAAEIPGVRLIEDPEGRVARRFGAYTSGQAILYDEVGRLRFAGGITPGRGHEGDNAGRDAIVSLVNHHTAELDETPVFGCPLTAADGSTRLGGRSCPR